MAAKAPGKKGAEPWRQRFPEKKVRNHGGKGSRKKGGGTMAAKAPGKKEGETMVAIAVCDDELLERFNISAKIQGFMEEMGIPCSVEQFGSGKELLKCPERFDLIFLDILMREMDGIETARRCRELSFEKTLIFLSSSRRYVFDAYDVEAFHYLVKPVDDEKLKHVLKRAVEKGQHVSQDYIVASRERQKRKIFLNSVRYFEFNGRQVDVCEERGTFTYYGQIGVLEKQLMGKGFFRCHKSYLLNLKYVEAYNRQEALLENGGSVPIAKRRYEAFCQEILAYMRKNGGIL